MQRTALFRRYPQVRRWPKVQGYRKQHGGQCHALDRPVVTLKIKIKPDESRCFGEVSVETSSTLCPASPIATSIFMSTDLKTGEVSASEVGSGENPMQEILPGVSGSMPGKITIFPNAKSASAGK